MKVLLIDNFDSFVFNLAQYLGSLGADPVVVRNDADTGSLMALRPDALVVSPGPGRPEDAGCSIDAIRRFAGRVPVLGVCLGHQAAAVAFGGTVGPAPSLVHGKTSRIHHKGGDLFDGLPNPFPATRYHSLVVDADLLPPEMEVTAWTPEGTVMGIRHRTEEVHGVQFHPESILTASGMDLLRNFLRKT